MKDYELSILFHPDLEMNLDPAIEKVKKLIDANGGVIVEEESEGKKHLSYTIKKQDYGVYYFINLQLEPAAPAKIENVLNITDEVIRHLLVKTDSRKAKYEARRQAREKLLNEAPEEEKEEEEK